MDTIGNLDLLLALVSSTSNGSISSNNIADSPIGKLPVPFATMSNLTLRALKYLWRGARFIPSPTQLAVIAAQEIGFSLANIIWQYKSSTSHIEEHSHMLSKYIHELRTTLGIDHVRKSVYVCFYSSFIQLRIVGHSLGCRMLLNSLREVEPHERPDEIFLCAPALNEQDYHDILHCAARQNTFILYNPQDMILSHVFPLMERKAALGCTEPKLDHGPRCRAFSVEQHFNVMVHGEYKYRFDKLVDSVVLDTKGY